MNHRNSFKIMLKDMMVYFWSNVVNLWQPMQYLVGNTVEDSQREVIPPTNRSNSTGTVDHYEDEYSHDGF
jgi:hypothetical protein